jgi:hypothetical protein
MRTWAYAFTCDVDSLVADSALIMLKGANGQGGSSAFRAGIFVATDGGAGADTIEASASSVDTTSHISISQYGSGEGAGSLDSNWVIFTHDKSNDTILLQDSVYFLAYACGEGVAFAYDTTGEVGTRISTTGGSNVDTWTAGTIEWASGSAARIVEIYGHSVAGVESRVIIIGKVNLGKTALGAP